MSRRNDKTSTGWSDLKRYRTGYVEWLTADFWSVVTLPRRGAEEIIAALRIFVMLFCWIVMMLTLPISLPIISYIKMKQTRTRLVRTYGLDELNK